MAKSRDFIYKDVIDADGKRLGYVKDLILDFGKNKVLGFKICPSQFMKKEFNVMREDILYSSNSIIAKNIAKGKFFDLASLINTHVIDKKFNMLGIVSEIIFDGDSFEIEGIFIKQSSIFSMFKPRKVLLTKDIIIGEKYILYTGSDEWVEMICTPSFGNSGREDLYYEKDTI